MEKESAAVVKSLVGRIAQERVARLRGVQDVAAEEADIDVMLVLVGCPQWWSPAPYCPHRHP